MNSADIETLGSLKAAMRIRMADAERELAFAAEMGGAAAERAMARRAGALADVAEIRAQLEKVGAI